MVYLETILTEEGSLIEETIRNYSLHASKPAEAKKYMEFLKQHLRLCCQYNESKVEQIVEKMVGKNKSSCYPIEDSLQICQEHH